MDTVHAKKIEQSDKDKELAFGAFVEAVRRDLLSRKLVSTTELTATDFKHLGVSTPKSTS